MEVEDVQVVVVQYVVVGVVYGEGMCGIVDDFQVVDIGDLLDCFDIVGVVVVMYWQDCGGLWGDCCFDL